MATMVRKQIYLRRDQDRSLKQVARQEGRTEAELVRQAIDDYTTARERRASWAEEKKFIEQWIKDAARNGPVKAGRSWRREDAYDRKVFSRH
jgi:hypothetical protein